MILVERSDPLTRAWLQEYAIGDFSDKPLDKVERADKTWLVRRDGEVILAAGIVRSNLLATPEVWVAVCKAFLHQKRENTIALRGLTKLLLERYNKVEAWVLSGSSVAERFAEAFGFRATVKVAHDGEIYVRYEARA